MHHSAANTHTRVNFWAPSHQTNSNMQKCPSGTIYKYHFPNTPGNWKSLPIYIWNTKGRVCLNAHNRDWLKELAKEIPEAKWGIQNIHNHPYQADLGSGQHSRLSKFNKLPNDRPQASNGQDITSALISTNQPHNCNIDKAPQKCSSQNLTRKVKDWRDWTYTDWQPPKEWSRPRHRIRRIPPSLKCFPLCKPKRHGYNQHHLTCRASSYI